MEREIFSVLLLFEVVGLFLNFISNHNIAFPYRLSISFCQWVIVRKAYKFSRFFFDEYINWKRSSKFGAETSFIVLSHTNLHIFKLVANPNNYIFV